MCKLEFIFLILFFSYLPSPRIISFLVEGFCYFLLYLQRLEQCLIQCSLSIFILWNVDWLHRFIHEQTELLGQGVWVAVILLAIATLISMEAIAIFLTTTESTCFLTLVPVPILTSVATNTEYSQSLFLPTWYRENVSWFHIFAFIIMSEVTHILPIVCVCYLIEKGAESFVCDMSSMLHVFWICLWYISF